uniref:ADF-H domain-containing protein n=1 Tax=Xiphophorus couchianus TaxID=32473 RepID=A0A3B5LMW2_9TELE
MYSCNLLREKLKKFRFRKETNNAAILSKYCKHRILDISLDDLRNELPERQPRYPESRHYKYTHADGRVSYPLCFIFSSPMGNNDTNLAHPAQVLDV